MATMGPMYGAAGGSNDPPNPPGYPTMNPPVDKTFVPYVKLRLTCDWCLRQHAKCDKQRPRCALCIKRGIPCVYSEAKQKGWTKSSENGAHRVSKPAQASSAHTQRPSYSAKAVWARELALIEASQNNHPDPADAQAGPIHDGEQFVYGFFDEAGQWRAESSYVVKAKPAYTAPSPYYNNPAPVNGPPASFASYSAAQMSAAMGPNTSYGGFGSGYNTFGPGCTPFGPELMGQSVGGTADDVEDGKKGDKKDEEQADD